MLSRKAKERGGKTDTQPDTPSHWDRNKQIASSASRSCLTGQLCEWSIGMYGTVAMVTRQTTPCAWIVRNCFIACLRRGAANCWSNMPPQSRAMKMQSAIRSSGAFTHSGLTTHWPVWHGTYSWVIYDLRALSNCGTILWLWLVALRTGAVVSVAG